MFDYRFTVVAPLSHGAPLAYSMAPRTVPTLVSRFTNPRPPVQNWTTKESSLRRPRGTNAVPRTRRSDYHRTRRVTPMRDRLRRNQ